MKTEEKFNEAKFFLKINRKIRQTVREHNLISENDRVLVGLSGGKDSMILLKSLANLKRSLPFSFDLLAAHVIPLNIGYQANTVYLQEYCKDLGLELILKEIILDTGRNNKSECFICSWHRRKALFDLTKELNCNKLAFGHHRDDAIQTFFMNMIYHGSISSLPYSLKMFEGRVRLIRPMLDLWEKDLSILAELKKLEAVEKSCPFEDKTKRKFTRELAELIEISYPKAKINIFHALDNLYPEYLPSVKSIKKRSI